MKKKELKAVKLLLLDVDGTLTDGTINIGPDGEVFKSFYCRDGLGLLHLKQKGIEPVIITARQSEIVKLRAAELGITEIHQNVKDKVKLLPGILSKYDVTAKEVAYIGDDVNDLEIMTAVGLVFAPADCHPDILSVVDIHLCSKGGKGAVRECADLLLHAKSKID